MNSCGADSDLGDLLELYSGSDVKFNALEDEIESDNVCGICSENLRSPRMLSCLHEFCEACLAELEGGSVSPELVNGEKDALVSQSKSGILVCPKCQQTTKLGPNGVKGLTLDLILIGPSEAPPTDANGSSILCTSCKAKEPAVGRCEDCSNFLCNNCFTAHKYMRVLENHRITTLEELQASGQVSPPPKYFPCPRHADKPIDYFCLPCQEACCVQCLTRVHCGPEHNCDSAQSVSTRFRTEIPRLGREAKSRLDDCRKASRQLEASFGQLEEQRTAAKKTVECAFQTFRAILENAKESVLGKIDEKHKIKELKAMENLNKLQTRMNKIESAEAFTGRMVDFGQEHAAALVEMWAVLHNQLYGLAGPVEPVDVVSKPIKFEYDADVFEKAVKKCIGKFMEEETPSSSPVAGSLPVGILQEEQTHILPQGLLSPDALRNSPVHPGPIQRPSQSLSLSPELTPVANVGGVIPSAAVGSATSSIGPPSLGDIQALTSALANTDLNNGYAPSHRTPTPDLTNQLGLRSIHQAYTTTSLQEFNLATQLANYVDKERQPMHNRHSSSPSLGPPTGAMTLADLIAGVESNSHSHALNNLQALVQLNSVQTGVPPQSNPIHGMRSAPTSRIGMGSGVPGPGGPAGLGSYPNLLNGLSNPPPAVPNPIRLPSSFESSATSLSPVATSALSATTITDVLQCWSDPTAAQKTLVARGTDLPAPVNVPLPLPISLLPKSSKINPMTVRVKFGSQGSMTKGGSSSSLASPHGFCLSPGEQIFVADTQNHSIKVFDLNGQFLYAFGSAGQEDGQLWFPRKIAVIRTTGNVVICDRGTERTRIQIFTCKGMFVRRLRVQYIDIVASVAVNRFGHIIAVDSNNPAIFQLEEQGNLKCWIDCIPFMKEPSDIAVSGSEYYVCDFKGHCVCVFHENGQFLRKIGGEPLTMFPNGVDMSDAGDLLVCDSHGNRFHVVVFSKDGTLTAEFDCPYVKVSRCCGLKITRDGYIITLAKNNHQVLVMNTLYIQ